MVSFLEVIHKGESSSACKSIFLSFPQIIFNLSFHKQLKKQQFLWDLNSLFLAPCLLKSVPLPCRSNGLRKQIVFAYTRRVTWLRGGLTKTEWVSSLMSWREEMCPYILVSSVSQMLEITIVRSSAEAEQKRLQ